MNEVKFSSVPLVGERVFKVPGGWNELSGRQVQALAMVLQLPFVQLREAIVRAIFIVLNVRRSLLLQWCLLWLGAEGRYDLRHLVEWVFQPVTLTRNPCFRVIGRRRKALVTNERQRRGYFGRLFGRRIVLYGPTDEMSRQCFMEFIKAETYYWGWKKSLVRDMGDYPDKPGNDGLRGSGDAGGNPDAVSEADEYLDKLIATLYRPMKREINWNDFDGDLRQLYNDTTIEQRVPWVAGLPLKKKMAIVLFYEGCRKQIVENPAFVEVFKRENKHAMQSRANDSARSGGTWIDALSSLAGQPIHLEQMAMMDRDTALWSLNKQIEQALKMEAQMEKMKRK